MALRLPTGEEPARYDLDVERTCLGSCLVYPEQLRTAEVSTRDFYGEAHRVIWRELQFLAAEGEPVDEAHLRARLAEIGKLAFVGGVEYLLSLTDVIPIPNPPWDLLRRYSKRRVLHELGRRLSAAGAVDDDDGAERALRDAHEALAAAAPRQPSALDELWRPIGTWITEPPLQRRWLLTRPDDETNGMTSKGVLPVGKAGMLFAEGGTGKTFALIQLAVSIVTGRRWLDYFDVPYTGPVLLVLGEEDREEIHRRLFAVARAMRLTEQQERLAGEQIIALPLAGKLVSIVGPDGASDSDFMGWLRDRLKGHDFRLVVIDPLSRFAGGDTEKDNSAATRFVQKVESLVTPETTVLVSHHSRKPPTGEAAAASAHNARGVTALGAGFRWTAELMQLGTGARFAVTKSNYAPRGRVLDLRRDEDTGYLTYSPMPLTPSRVEESEGRYTRDLDALVDLVRRHPGKSRAALIAMAGIADRRGTAMFDELEQRGLLRHSEGPRGAKQMHLADSQNGPDG